MMHHAHNPIASEKFKHEQALTERFLDTPNEDSFAAIFHSFQPQLIAFFRAHRCEPPLAEDLTQEVMLRVYFKAAQLRDRSLFHGWLFTIARNALRRHYGKRAREVDTVDLSDVVRRVTASKGSAATSPAFEFRDWMGILNSRERDLMTLRFIEQWEYHEIAAARAMPIGTVQWTVFNAKKKLAPRLEARKKNIRRAA
jgi:RNA polymerase sigma-70 factor (ECF subfamily)